MNTWKIKFLLQINKALFQLVSILIHLQWKKTKVKSRVTEIIGTKAPTRIPELIRLNCNLHSIIVQNIISIWLLNIKIWRAITCEHWAASGDSDCLQGQGWWCGMDVSQNQTRGDYKVPNIMLEAVASYNLWVWHAFFGAAGSNNDINVLDQSPLFT